MDRKEKIEAALILVFMLAIGTFLLASNNSEKCRMPGVPNSKMDIIEAANVSGNFTSLTSALETTGLTDVLKSDGPFTVFAPTDRAFEKLPVKTLEELLKPENKDKLTALLKHHVIVNEMIMLRGRRFKSLNGSRLTINDLGEIIVNEARIIARNIPAKNGIIHVIDTVMIPEDDQYRKTAKRIITEALNMGMPLYNCGNARACAAVYRSALSDLMGMPKGTFSTESRRWISRMFIAASEMENPREKAWAFRSVMDDILAELEYKKVAKRK